MQFELAIHKGAPDGVQGETAIQVACFYLLMDVDCLQDPPPPVSGFLFKHLSFLPVPCVVVTVGMDHNPVLIILLPHCILVFHNLLLQILRFTDVARVIIHARGLIQNVFLLYILNRSLYSHQGLPERAKVPAFPFDLFRCVPHIGEVEDLRLLLQFILVLALLQWFPSSYGL